VSYTFALLFDYKCWQRHVNSSSNKKNDFYGVASTCYGVRFPGLFGGMMILYAKN
jgi:hypothetical protein